jgi:hypothetical protein
MIAKMKRSKCPPLDKWVKATCPTVIVSALKKEGILPYVTTWMNLEDVTLSEMSQTRKDARWCHFYEVPKIVKLPEAENRMVAVRGWGKGNWGGLIKCIKFQVLR